MTLLTFSDHWNTFDYEVMMATENESGKRGLWKHLWWIILGTAAASGVAAVVLWDRKPLPHGIYEGKAWYCFEEEGIPFIDIEGAIFVRCPQIPVDVNRIDDADYQEILRREMMKCMRNLDYDSPYAIEYLLEFVGFRQTPLARLKAAGRKHIRDFKRRQEERRQAELIDQNDCFLQPE
jgi:hypothetical protein